MLLRTKLTMLQKLLQIDGAVTIEIGFVDESLDVIGMHVEEVFGMREGAEFVLVQLSVAVDVSVDKLGLVFCR